MSAPVTPENTPFAARAALRRSFTVPPKLDPAKPRSAEIGAAAGIETLYIHPAAKVVSFGTSSNRPSSSSSNAESDGSLPWASPTERTLAAGPLEIYRVPGSVSFLHSGSLLHAIMPRSQCWCVDGVSKFAFRVLPNQYYRIELPGETEEDMEMVERLKVTLKKVLFYERTTCPFRRGFNLDLPEMVDIKERRKSNRLSTGPVKRWTFDQKWRPEGAEDDEDYNSSRPSSVCISDAGRSEMDLSEISLEDRANPEVGLHEFRTAVTPEQSLAPPGPPRGMHSIRSVTAPPQLSLRFSPPSKVLQLVGSIDAVAQSTSPRVNLPKTITPKLPPTPESMQDEFTQSSGENITKYQTEDDSIQEVVIAVTNEDVDLADEDENHVRTPKIVDSPKRSESLTSDDRATQDERTFSGKEPDRQAEDESEKAVQNNNADGSATDNGCVKEETTNSITISPNPSVNSSSSSSSSLDSWSSLPTTAPESFRLRRDYTSISSSSSSSSSYQSLASSLADVSLNRTCSHDQKQKQKQKQQQHKISRFTGTSALLVRRTCAMFLGPPAHLVATMLRIAAKIMAGGMQEFDMSVHMLPPIRGHKRVPGSWDMSDDEEEWGI